MTGETPDRMTVFLELSHTLETGMPVYPGHAVVELLLAEAEPPRQLMHLHAGTHSGTHIDAARHFVPSGRTVDEYPIDRFVLPAVVLPVRASEDEEIGWAALASSLAAVPPGAAVLLNTGGTATGGTGRCCGTPTSALRPARAWSPLESDWSAPMRSTSTVPSSARRRRTRSCSATMC
jgi:kynurenine formamidase